MKNTEKHMARFKYIEKNKKLWQIQIKRSILEKYIVELLQQSVLRSIITIIIIIMDHGYFITINDRLTVKRKCISFHSGAGRENICFQNVLQSAPGGFDRARFAHRLPRDGV